MKWLIPVGDGQYLLRRRGELVFAAVVAGLLGLVGVFFIAVAMGWMGDVRPEPVATQVRTWLLGIYTAIGALYALYLVLTMRRTLVDVSYKSVEIRSLWFDRVVALHPFQEVQLLKVGLGGKGQLQRWQVFFFDSVSTQRVVLARFGSWDRAAEAVQELAALTGIPYEIPPKPKEPVSFRLFRP